MNGIADSGSTNYFLEHRVLQWGAVALVLLLISLPLAHVALVRSFTFMLAVVAAAILYVRGKRHDLPLLLAFLVWLAAACLSLLSLSDVGEAVELIWREVGKGALVFYAAFVLARERAVASLWFHGAATALFVLASLSIAARVESGAWVAVGLVPSLGDYNTSALTLFPLVALPLFCRWRNACGRFSLLLSLFTIVLGLIAGTLTMSRGFWLIVALLFLLTMLPLRWRMKFNGKKTLFWTLAALVLLGVMAYGVAQWRGLELLRFEERERIYWPVLQHVLSAPWNGFGYGHESQKAWYVQNMPYADIFHAHNLFLSYIEQMGPPGIAVLIGLFGGLGRQFVRHFQDGDLRQSSLAALGLALVIAIFIRNNLDIFFVRHNLLLFFLVCGLMLGMLEAEKKENA